MATSININMDQGSDFSVEFTVQAANGNSLDLTSFTSNSHMRENHTSNVAYTFTAVTANGTVTITMPAAQTAIIESGKYVYDVKVTSSSNEVFKVVQGTIDVVPAVTR